MTDEFTICDAPTDADRAAILDTLAAFNARHGYPADPKPVAILIKDEAGQVTGGLWGRTVYGWLYVDYLVVPDSMRGRGLGSKILLAAEQVARDHGCAGSWLTTFSFQAQGFYEKLGYSTFGQLEKSPRDNVRIFLRKIFEP
jgi:GNAT superfamily N-acetyltransferase